MATITARAPATLSVATLDDVRDWGWSPWRLAQEVNDFRLHSIADLSAGLQPAPARWGKLYYDLPGTWRMLITGPEQIAGFWQFLPLTATAHTLFRSGRTLIHKPLAEVIQPLDRPGWYDISLYTVSVHPQFRNALTAMLLANSLLNVITDLARRGILIRELMAGIVTREGRMLNRGLGLNLEYVADHEVTGQVYAGHFPSILRRRIVKESPDVQLKTLCELYAAQEASLADKSWLKRSA